MKRYLPLLAAVGVLAFASGCCCCCDKKCPPAGKPCTAQCGDGQCGEEKKDAKDTERKNAAENSGENQQEKEKKNCCSAAETRLS